MPDARHLVIFSRYPVLGRGKRRLAKDIGAVRALHFQRVNLKLTLLRLGGDQRWTTWIGVTPDRSGPWPVQFRTVPQGQGDLGLRMVTVARALPPGPVIIIGCDIPGITATHIASGFRASRAHDSVFGPASDGGYWLVGLRQNARLINPFRNIRWSTEYALADTLKNLAGRDVALLDTLADVDTGASLQQYRNWHSLFDSVVTSPVTGRTRDDNRLPRPLKLFEKSPTAGSAGE